MGAPPDHSALAACRLPLPPPTDHSALAACRFLLPRLPLAASSAAKPKEPPRLGPRTSPTRSHRIGTLGLAPSNLRSAATAVKHLAQARFSRSSPRTSPPVVGSFAVAAHPGAFSTYPPSSTGGCAQAVSTSRPRVSFSRAATRGREVADPLPQAPAAALAACRLSLQRATLGRRSPRRQLGIVAGGTGDHPVVQLHQPVGGRLP